MEESPEMKGWPLRENARSEASSGETELRGASPGEAELQGARTSRASEGEAIPGEAELRGARAGEARTEEGRVCGAQLRICEKVFEVRTSRDANVRRRRLGVTLSKIHGILLGRG